MPGSCIDSRNIDTGVDCLEVTSIEIAVYLSRCVGDEEDTRRFRKECGRETREFTRIDIPFALTDAPDDGKGTDIRVLEEPVARNGIEEEHIEQITVNECKRMRSTHVPNMERNVLFSVDVCQWSRFRCGHFDVVVSSLECYCKFKE